MVQSGLTTAPTRTSTPSLASLQPVVYVEDENHFHLVEPSGEWTPRPPNGPPPFLLLGGLSPFTLGVLVIGCCTSTPVDVDPDLDVPIALEVLEHAVAGMVGEGVRMGIQLPGTGTLLHWPLHTGEIADLLDSDVTAWVVQRPGCAGLVTRVLVVGPERQLVAVIAPNRRNATPEPESWRIHLLLGLARAA